MARRLIGATAALGLVSIVAGCDEPSVTAQCVQDENGEQSIVTDEHCTDHQANDNGFFVWGGHQYRYYYGSQGAIGQRPRGGSTAYPGDEDEDGYSTAVRTGSGKSITRGGLGGAGGKASGGS